MELSSKSKKLSQKEIKELRLSGKRKPVNVTWKQWESSVKLSAVHDMMCYRLATGNTEREIAEMTGYQTSAIKKILGTDQCQFRVKEIQYQLYGRDPQKQFGRLMDKAFKAVEGLLDKEAVKDSTKLAASKEIFDRALGKSVQKMEFENVGVKDIYKKLDQLINNQPKTINVAKKEEIEEAEIVEPKKIEQKIVTDEDQLEHKKTEEIEKIDEWMEKNL